MAGPPDDILNNVPSFEAVMNSVGAPPDAPPPPDHNALVAGLMSGVYGGLSNLGSATRAVANVAGAPGLAQAAANFSAAQQANAAPYARPDLDNAPWYSPTKLLYQTAQGVPQIAAAIGGGALATIGAPEIAEGAGVAGLLSATGLRGLGGAAAASYPFTVGQNVERAQSEGQPVDAASSAKALALGVPEALVQGALPAFGEAAIAGKAGAKLLGSRVLGGAATGAAIQVPAGAATEALMQNMGDPNRTFASRSQGIIDAALGGAIQGAIFGGGLSALHGLAKKPANTVTGDDLGAAVDAVVDPPTSPVPGVEPKVHDESKINLGTPEYSGAVGLGRGTMPVPGAEPQQTPAMPNLGQPAPAGVGAQLSTMPVPGAVPRPSPVLDLGQPASAGLMAAPQLANVPPVTSGDRGTVVTPARSGMGDFLKRLRGNIEAQPHPQQVDESTLNLGLPAKSGLVPPTPLLPPPSGEASTIGSGQDAITPPPVPDKLSDLSNAQLIQHGIDHGWSGPIGEKITDEISSRFPGFKGSGQDLVGAMAQQDQDRAQAALEQSHAQKIKAATKGSIPSYLKPFIGDEAGLKGAIFDRAQGLKDAGQPVGNALTKIADTFDLLDDKGNLVDPRPPQGTSLGPDTEPQPEQGTRDPGQVSLGPDTEAQPDVAAPVPVRPKRSAIQPGQAAKFDRLEKLRNSLPANLGHLSPEIDDMQSSLALQSTDTKAVVDRTNAIAKAVRGAKAVEDITPGAKTEPAAAATPVDEETGAKKFDTPAEVPQAAEAPATTPAEVPAATTPETPAAPVSKQDQVKAAQRLQGKGRATPEVKPAAPAPAAALEPGHQAKIEGALRAMQSGLVDLSKREIPAQTKGEKPATTAKRNTQFRSALDELDGQQAEIGKAVTSDDPVKALSAIKDDHFGTKIADDFYDKADPATQELMDQHEQHINKLLDAVQDATGGKNIPREQVYASRPTTQLDRDLGGLVDGGGSARQMLEHIVRNGSSSIRRTIAAKLLQLSKADPTIRFGTQDEGIKDHPSVNSVYGDYNDKLNRIRVFDQSDLEHTVLHEFTHAATVKGIEGSPEIRARFKDLLSAARDQLNPAERTSPAFKNVHEFIAEAMSNPHVASLLDGMSASKGGSIWGAIKSTVRRMFGLPKAAESMLDHVMNLGGEAMDETNRLSNTPEGYERTTGLYARQVQDRADQLADVYNKLADPKGWWSKIYGKMLAWREEKGIAHDMATHVPAIGDHYFMQEEVHNNEDALNGVTNAAHYAVKAMSPQDQAKTEKLQTYTALNINPRLPRNKQPWLDAHKDQPAINKAAKEAHDLYNDLNRRGMAKAYDAQDQVNQAHMAAAQVHILRNLADAGYAKMTLGPDPMRGFRFDKTDLKDSPARTAKYWKAALDAHVNAANDYTGKLRAALDEQIEKDPSLASKYNADYASHVEAINGALADITRQQFAAGQGPNFALRRKGTHWISGTTVEGYSDKHAQMFQEALQKAGFQDVVLQGASGSHEVYIRVPGETQAENARKVFKDMQVKNVLVKDTMKDGVRADENIKSGLMGAVQRTPGLLPGYATMLLKHMRENYPALPEGADAATRAAYEQARETALDDMTNHIMDMMPDNSTAKLFAHRDNVQGFSGKMHAAFMDRSLNMARAVANLSSAPGMAQARRDMLKQSEALRRNDSVPVGVQSRAQQAVSEVMLRDAQRSLRVAPSPLDALRQTAHLYELGISVPYAITLATQLFTLSPAELNKHFSYARSMMGIMRASGRGVTALRAMFSGDDWLGGVMTRAKLEAAGMSAKDVDFLLTQSNMGSFNSSRTQWVQDNTKHHDGFLKNVHDYSSAWTLACEMAPRLITALAAHDLYNETPVKGRELHEFVKDKVENSQFSWLNTTNPRAFGKHGVAGAVSPMFAQFQGYRVKLMEKLVQETTDAFGARGPEYAAQGRKFMLAHLAAMSVVSGTLGAPAVSWAAGLYDRVADALSGDDTHDIKASYRMFLRTTFGDQVGEAIAHGVPRLAGIDLAHQGEDNLLPATSLMEDKRKWEDAFPAYLKKVAGSTVGLLSDTVLAGRDLYNGDFLAAASKALPEALRNVAEAGQIGLYGYTDKSGFQTPTHATTGDVWKKALGLDPADEARYDEEKRTYQGLTDRSDYDKQNIMEHLSRAYNRHDPAQYAAWMQASRSYQMSHPGQPPPAAGFGDYLNNHAQSAGMAAMLGVPVNVRPNDYLARGMVSLGNRGNQ